MNEQNLRPFTSDQSHEEAVENGRKGGIASGESKRRRKTLREELLLLLESGDTQQRVATALIDEAINGNNAGSVRGAFETIRDSIGEKMAEKIETKQTIVDMSKFTTDEIKAILDDDV